MRAGLSLLLGGALLVGAASWAAPAVRPDSDTLSTAGSAKGQTKVMSCTRMDILLETGYTPTRDDLIAYLQQCGELAYQIVLGLRNRH